MIPRASPTVVFAPAATCVCCQVTGWGVQTGAVSILATTQSAGSYRLITVSTVLVPVSVAQVVPVIAVRLSSITCLPGNTHLAVGIAHITMLTI